MQLNMPFGKKLQDATFLQVLEFGVTGGDIVQNNHCFSLSTDFKKKQATKPKSNKPKKVASKKKVAPSSVSLFRLSLVLSGFAGVESFTSCRLWTRCTRDSRAVELPSLPLMPMSNRCGGIFPDAGLRVGSGERRRRVALLGGLPREVADEADSPPTSTATSGMAVERRQSKTSPLHSEEARSSEGLNGDERDNRSDGEGNIPLSSIETTPVEAPTVLPYSDVLTGLLSEPIAEVLIGALVLLSSIVVALETLPTLPIDALLVVNSVQGAISYLFTLEFLLRWYASGQLKGGYLSQPLVVLDIVVVILPLLLGEVLPHMGQLGQTAGMMLPTWLMSSSGLVNLRLLRILRLQRVLTDMDTFTKFEIALGLRPSDVRPYQLQLARVVVSVFTLLSVSAGLIYTAECNVNPDIPDYFTALYFGLTTLTTVGFGDITPVTFEGRLVVCGTILAGVAIVPAQAASLAEAFMVQQREVMGTSTAEEGRDGSDLSSSSRDDGTVTIVEPDSRERRIDDSTKCQTCGMDDHRDDASFCWSCGSRL